MKRKFLSFIIISFLSLFTIHAQHAIGSWQMYLSYQNVIHSEPAGNLVYAIGNGGLFSYDKEDMSIQCYHKVNFLNDTDIAYIAYQATNKTLVIVYSNANIDLLVDNKDIYNLPDYMNKNMPQDKNIHHICFAKDYAYLSTSFGIIVLNLKKREISNAYILNKKINACSVDDNKIYAASSEGLYTGLLTDNLLDVNKWKKVSDSKYSHLNIYNKELIGNVASRGIFLINKDTYTYSQLVNGSFDYMYVYNDKLLAGNKNSLTIFYNLNKYYYISNIQQDITHTSFSNGTYWVSSPEEGLIGFKYNEQSNTFENNISPIVINSPKRNLFYYMNFEGDRLFITGGAMAGDRFNYEGTIMTFENNNWDSFQEKGINEQTKLDYKDITSIAQDPTDKEHHFVSSAGEGLYEFKNQKFIKLYNLDNSLLETGLPNSSDKNKYLRINALIYDKDNNLWMSNSGGGSNGVKNAIKILKPDGKWISLYYPEIAGATNLERSLFDKRGWFWLTSERTNNSGIFCVDTKGTIEDPSDDQHRFISKFINQDGTVLDPHGVHCITEDKDGAIWVGTTGHGPLVINNPTKFFDENFYCTQIKVPRNDGTNLADFLLANETISAIAVDGANRKWIGTATNGLYLISADGMETIHHFTIENSSLPSNNIESVAINAQTGEIFIGTSKGLISYQSDATEAGENFSDDIYAYPNPVESDYTGVITVTGLVRDTNVKIINVNGKLIYEGTSVGGQFTWDGKNPQGNRVSSGIYFVLAADSEGKEGIATKIAFIK